MTRPTLLNGEIWEAAFANAAGFPQMTGEDIFGHGPLIRDENMSNDAGQLKPVFYDWYNRIRVTSTGGLSIAYTGAAIRLANGTTVDLPGGVVVLPDDATGWVYINSAGDIQAGATLPVQGIILSSYVTASGNITELNDLRQQVVETVAPLQIDNNSGFDIGDIKPSARQNPSNGWLRMDGAEYSVSTYPLLFSAIGTTFNLSTTPVGFFRVPDSRDRAIAGAGTVRALGAEWGEEAKRLSISEMPSHTHTATTAAHTHGISDAGHAHAIYDGGHSHSMAPYRPYAEGNGTRGAGAELTAVPKAGIVPVSTQVSATGIGIYPSASNISLQAAAPSVTVNSQGGGTPFSLAQPSTAVNWYIRAF